MQVRRDRHDLRPSTSPTDSSFGIAVEGIPDSFPNDLAASLRGRLTRSAQEVFKETSVQEITFTVRKLTPGASTESGENGKGAQPSRFSSAQESLSNGDELDLDKRMTYFSPAAPSYTLEQLVLPRETMQLLQLCIDTVRLKERVFGTWGLSAIEPHPRIVVNLHGLPGTGKTLAAHGIAHELKAPILEARVSQLESKYHGEGGKYLDALFAVAARTGSVLFIDEAESLLSRRFESVSQGSEHAINVMRSELIQHLDRFDGVVMFATNLVQTYDPAINNRLRHVRIPPPDCGARKLIWERHLPPSLPLGDDVNLHELAKVDDVVGRDIKQAVILAAVTAARQRRDRISHQDLISSIRAVVSERPSNKISLPDSAGKAGLATEAEAQELSATVVDRLGRTARMRPP